MQYRILLKTAELTDACSSDTMITYEHPHNSYTPKKKNIAGQRIDHILYRNNLQIKATIVEYLSPLPEVIPETNFSFSDHEAIMVKLTLEAISVNKHLCDNDEDDLIRMESKTKSNLISMMNGGGKTFNNDNQCLSHQYRPVLEYSHIVSVIEDAIIMCNNHLNMLKRNRIFYYVLATLLISAMFILFVIPDNYNILYYLLKLCLFCAFLYCIFMAVLWNPMERHGILAGLKSMETKLSNIHMQLATE